MGRRWFDDLTGDDLADENVHTLAITLDGDPLAAYDVGARPADDLLAALRDHLVETIAARIAPDGPLDPGPLDGPVPTRDESAEDRPSAGQSIEEPGVVVVTEPPMSANPAKADTAAAPVAVPGTLEPQRRGEAERGKATDAQVRTWATSHGIPCSTTGAIKAWVREAYERVDGAVPDFEARRRARSAGADLTTPSVRPEVAGASTIATWCLRNGVEDRGGNVTVSGRVAYAEAWRTAHPDEKPPAASSAGQGPPTPGERAGRAIGRVSGQANGHRLPTQSTDDASEPAAAPTSVRPAVEPIGDGSGDPASTAAQLARADELAADGKTPKQICSETGVWLSEARAAVRKATER